MVFLMFDSGKLLNFWMFGQVKGGWRFFMWLEKYLDTLVTLSALWMVNAAALRELREAHATTAQIDALRAQIDATTAQLAAERAHQAKLRQLLLYFNIFGSLMLLLLALLLLSLVK
jgi:hypothetical protein